VTKKSSTICVRLPESTLARIREATQNFDDRSMSYVVRKAVERYFESVDAGLISPVSEETSA
jgi:predicted DNA-binding protein